MVKNLIPQEKRLPFFVYVIESPDAVDMYHSRFEGDLLKKALELNQIPCSHRIAVNKEAFVAAIRVGLLEEHMKWLSNLVPIIHISAHGDSRGLVLTNNEFVLWGELRNLVADINKALQGNLLVCMSACEGLSGCAMAMDEQQELPFFALIGHNGKPRWSDTAIAYASFYHLLAKGYYIPDAVDAMRRASGEDDFQIITAMQAKEAYIKLIKDGLPQSFQQALQQDIQQNPPPQGAKQLENKKG